MKIDRKVWQRPAVVRMDAADAQNGDRLYPADAFAMRRMQGS